MYINIINYNLIKLKKKIINLFILVFFYIYKKQTILIIYKTVSSLFCYYN